VIENGGRKTPIVSGTNFRTLPSLPPSLCSALDSRFRENDGAREVVRAFTHHFPLPFKGRQTPVSFADTHLERGEGGDGAAHCLV
jgi:hypothetical protein